MSRLTTSPAAAVEPVLHAAVVRASTRVDDAARDAFVRAHPRGTFFHLSGWRRAVERVFDHRAADFIALDGERVTGVLPLMQAPSMWGEGSLISMPFAVYGGALGETVEIEAALVAAARRRAEELRAGRLELRYRDGPAPGTDGWQPFDLYATFVRDLPEDPAQVLAGMPKKSRAEARKARDKHGLELSEGIWYLPDLHRLFHHNKHNLGSPGLPLLWFHHLRQEFGKDVTVHLVHRGKEPLAAVMSFLYGDTLLAYYSGTAEGADRSYSASNFMYMALQEWSAARGFKHFDFGRSRRDSGAFSFKENQGFEARALHYRIALVRDRALPSFNPSNPKTKILRDTWRRLPPWLATRLSDRVARYVP